MSTTAYAPPARAPAKSLVERAELAAVFAILFLMSGALLAPLFSPDQNPDSVPWLRTLWLPVYGAVAVLLALRPLAVTKVAVPLVMSLFLVGWSFLSTRWSMQPDVSLRRTIALLFTNLFGLYLACRYSWRQLAEIFAALFVALAIGAAIASVGFPGLGANDPVHPGAWNGLWYEKNQMGGLMVHGALACACAALFAPERRRLWSAAAAVCLIALVMSRSTTSLVAVAVGLGAMGAVVVLRRGGWVTVIGAWAILGVAGALAYVLAFAPDLFFGALGKDSSLTGRTDIWAAVLRQVEKRPMLGYGFGAVWSDPWGPAWFIRQEVRWKAPTAHNGWLDVLLQLGAVGLALCVVHFVVTAAMAVVRLFKGREAAWAIPFMIVFGLLSISESTILGYNNLPWLLYVMVGAKLFEWSGVADDKVRRAPSVKLFPD